ncbi:MULTISPECIES: hypothetical protein [Corynebacterium]|uniref:hypothetical protein n=1 Tax=Corynebacterium TaxID=1716 RepID=UPI00130135B9|nr:MULTISPECIES: hypothetical protein [Corynebacterium]MDN5683200.1 hypothetical protein [Corynebacterium glyciniphilum]MDN6705856.1 hypothetical protein [Corynebacterium glyciniphilum]
MSSYLREEDGIVAELLCELVSEKATMLASTRIWLMLLRGGGGGIISCIRR